MKRLVFTLVVIALAVACIAVVVPAEAMLIPGALDVVPIGQQAGYWGIQYQVNASITLNISVDGGAVTTYVRNLSASPLYMEISDTVFGGNYRDVIIYSGSLNIGPVVIGNVSGSGEDLLVQFVPDYLNNLTGKLYIEDDVSNVDVHSVTNTSGTKYSVGDGTPDAAGSMLLDIVTAFLVVNVSAGKYETVFVDYITTADGSNNVTYPGESIDGSLLGGSGVPFAQAGPYAIEPYVGTNGKIIATGGKLNLDLFEISMDLQYLIELELNAEPYPTPSTTPTSVPGPKYNLTVNQSLSCCNVSVAGHANASSIVVAGTTNTFIGIPQNTVLTVAAMYNGSCNAWNKWTGNVTNVNATTTTVVMNASKTITARCANVPFLTLTVNQAGSCCNVTVVGGGINATVVGAGTSRVFNISTNASSKVVNVTAAYSGICNTWGNWIGDPVANPSAMSTWTEVVNNNESITANCTYVAPTTTKYNLTVNQSASCCNVTVSGHTNASGAVVAGSSNTFYYIPQNTVLTLVSAFNGSCNYFSGWTGSVTNASARNTTVNMTSTRTITAGCINATLYRLTVNQAGSCCNVTVGGGRGTVAAGQSRSWDVPSGTVVSLTAAYNSTCNKWNNWTGGVVNASAMSTTVNVTANKTVTAGCTYTPSVPPAAPKYSLTVNQSSSCCNVTVSGHANASGTVAGGATRTFSNIPQNTVLRVNASFNASCDTWGNWSGTVANVSAMNTTVTMSANRSITANCTYSEEPAQGGGGRVPSWLWPVVGVMIFLSLVLFGYAANRAGWIGKPKGWFGGQVEDYTAEGFGEEDVYDKLYGETGPKIDTGSGGGIDIEDDEL